MPTGNDQRSFVSLVSVLSRTAIASVLLAGLSLCGLAAPSFAHDFSLKVAGELRYFPGEPEYSDHQHHNLSLAIEPSYHHEWNNGRSGVSAVLFARLDENDPRRNRFDVRELEYREAFDRWEWRVGVRKVFWGVTEAVHLVDILNQTDLSDGPDGEEKLGQPMLDLGLVTSYGNLNLFVLPYFRERQFGSTRGRPSLPFELDHDDAKYESSAEEWHTDFALRWSHSLGEWDVGVSYFRGTTREPRFYTSFDVFVKPDLSIGVNPTTVAYYEIIDQAGLDVQYTHEGWLLKFEGISRSGQGNHFVAAAGGFEYTFYSVFGSDCDLGVLSEYLYDSRDNQVRFTPPAAFPPPPRTYDPINFADNDLFGGLRLTLNDAQSTELLAGAIVDLHTHANSWFVEASRRLGENFKLSLEARIFSTGPDTEPLRVFRKDDFVQLELAWYF